MYIDLNADVRKALSKRILTEIDQWAIDNYNDGHRNHLGASLIGEECKRKLWYGFRWVKAPVFTGRILRLFNRGHLEEHRNNAWLRAIGATVWETDANAPAKPDGTQPQIRVHGVHGHFGGSCDGVVQFPQSWGNFPPMLLEYKTKATGSGFNALGNEGVMKADAVHWAQMCVYGYKLGLKYAAYFSTNKNDESMHIEVVELSAKTGQHMEEKAELIITSREAPERFSTNPTTFKCKVCNFADICHNGAPIEKNCRSCSKSVPTYNGEWWCEHNNGVIPADIIRIGCGVYDAVKDGF